MCSIKPIGIKHLESDATAQQRYYDDRTITIVDAYHQWCIDEIATEQITFGENSDETDIEQSEVVDGVTFTIERRFEIEYDDGGGKMICYREGDCEKSWKIDADGKVIPSDDSDSASHNPDTEGEIDGKSPLATIASFHYNNIASQIKEEMDGSTKVEALV